MRPPAPQRPGPWTEAARVALALVWAATLTYWIFATVSFLEAGSSWTFPVLGISNVVRVTTPIFWAALLSSLAVATAFHTVLYVRRSTGLPHRLRGTGDRRARSQVWMSFATALCLLAVLWRILPYGILVRHSSDPSHTSQEFLYGACWPLPAPYTPFWIAGALGLALIVTQAWSLVPGLGGRRRSVVAVIGTGLVAGATMTALDLDHAMAPLPIRPGDVAADPLAGALVLGGSGHDAELHERKRWYFETHGPGNRVFPHLRLTRPDSSGIPGRAQERREVYGRDFDWCGVCALPTVGVWTLRGVGIQLAEGTPAEDVEPAAVVEVARDGRRTRVYRPGSDDSLDPFPLSSLEERLPSGDWLVLKIDHHVPMLAVRDLLARLDRAGVRRVDLAAYPRAVPRDALDRPLRLVFRDDGTAVDAPIILDPAITPRFEPPLPPGWAESCEPLSWWEYALMTPPYIFEEPVPEIDRVRLKFEADERYGDVLPRIAMQNRARARVVHVVVSDEALTP